MIKFIIPIVLISLLVLNTKNLLVNGSEDYPARILLFTWPAMLLFGVIFSIIIKNVEEKWTRGKIIIALLCAVFIIFSWLYLFFSEEINAFFNRFSPAVMGISVSSFFPLVLE